jgi:hypothetical protein
LPPDLAPCVLQVPGFLRADPSTTRDKAGMQFRYILHADPHFVNTFFVFFLPKVHNSAMDI